MELPDDSVLFNIRALEERSSKISGSGDTNNSPSDEVSWRRVEWNLTSNTRTFGIRMEYSSVNYNTIQQAYT